MSAFYEFTGRVISVGQTENLGRDPNKPFKKRVIVVDGATSDDKYPNTVPFETTGDKCSLLDACRKGDEVTVKFCLNGREWKDKQGLTRYFCANRVISIARNAVMDVPIPMAEDVGGDDEVDDMPF